MRGDSRVRFVWLWGVLVWGVLTAIFWSLAMTYVKSAGAGFWDYLRIALFTFPIGGYCLGSWMWKRRGITLAQHLSDHLESLFGSLDPSTFPPVTELPNNTSLTVTMRPAKKLAWSGIGLFSMFSILSFLFDRPFLSLPFFGFIGVNIFLLSISGTIRLSSSKITLEIPLGRYEIGWNDVICVETDIQRGAIVFVGNNNQVALAGPGWWDGSDKAAAISYLNSETKRLGIRIKQSQKALFKLSKRSRAE
jgi:hypothetical protein